MAELTELLAAQKQSESGSVTWIVHKKARGSLAAYYSVVDEIKRRYPTANIIIEIERIN